MSLLVILHKFQYGIKICLLNPRAQFSNKIYDFQKERNLESVEFFQLFFSLFESDSTLKTMFLLFMHEKLQLRIDRGIFDVKILKLWNFQLLFPSFKIIA